MESVDSKYVVEDIVEIVHISTERVHEYICEYEFEMREVTGVLFNLQWNINE